MANQWGGKRDGAGRRAQAADGTQRKVRSIRASEHEWELLRAFDKIMKDDPERAERILETK